MGDPARKDDGKQGEKPLVLDYERPHEEPHPNLPARAGVYLSVAGLICFALACGLGGPVLIMPGLACFGFGLVLAAAGVRNSRTPGVGGKAPSWAVVIFVAALAFIFSIISFLAYFALSRL